MRKRLLLFGAAAALAVGLTATPAYAGSLILTDVAKSPEGPWKQEIKVNLAPGQARNVYLRVKSSTGDPEPSTVWQPNETSAKLRVKYFRGGQNISSEVKTFTSTTPSGYEFTASPDKFKKFRVRVKGLNSTGTLTDCVTQFWAPDELGAVDEATNTGINDNCA